MAMHRAGEGGLAKDEKLMARYWEEAASESNHTGAMNGLGVAALLKNDTDSAVRWFTRAMQAGSADAARRKELSSQLRALPMSKDTMEEVIKAKAEWCAANPAAAASSPVCAVKKASSAGLKTEPRV